MITTLLILGALAQAATACSDGSVAVAVEAQRAAFNEAIRLGNAEAIRDILAADVVLVAGTHSDLFMGRAEQMKLWREEFTAAPDHVVYVRTPGCITPSDITEMAMEDGRWQGKKANGDFATGRYTAKWRLIDDAWRLEAEIFMTESCSGEFCPSPAD
jgi:ketosteroid isomerase-like protein